MWSWWDYEQFLYFLSFLYSKYHILFLYQKNKKIFKLYIRNTHFGDNLGIWKKQEFIFSALCQPFLRPCLFTSSFHYLVFSVCS